jgi:predicted transcriptional regulator
MSGGTISTKEKFDMAKGPTAGVRFEVEVKAALEKLAAKDDRTVSYLVNKIVADYLRAKRLIK